MKFTNPLDQALGQKSKVKALRYLVNYKKEISIRELAREIKMVPANLSVILKELQNEGILTSKRFGRSLVFSLNQDHYLTSDVIIPLFRKEKDIKNKLKQIILKSINFSYESIILFGSVKRGNEKPQSDIDVAFIVRDKDLARAEKETMEINQAISRIFGNSISPVVLSQKEFVKRLKNKDKFVSVLSREGEVLAGKSVSGLL